MLDKIHLTKKNISDSECCQIIVKSKLRKHYLNGKAYFDNKDTKDFNGGFYIKIDVRGALKIVGSVHKFSNFLKTGLLDNYNTFTISEAKETLYNVLDYYGISADGLMVHLFELGANIPVKIPPAELLEQLESIGSKKFYFNPIYKNESVKTTDLHRDFRVVYKVYDKLHELHEKKRRPPENAINLIRLETTYRRVQKTEISDFLTIGNLQKLQAKFISDFMKLNFSPFIIYTGSEKTAQYKIELARLIVSVGTIKALEICKERFLIGEITPKQYKTQRMFVNYWFKSHMKNYKTEKPKFSPSWDCSLISEFQKITEKSIT
ncbi:hypothetical protein [Elizabethkingia anophelis]|uniref:hypothetical protein n=1 Tax=Elizabethkingia anophelis TaxID=1117645 RepID=UPI0038920DEE